MIQAQHRISPRSFTSLYFPYVIMNITFLPQSGKAWDNELYLHCIFMPGWTC